jgi:hypothetical protein
LTAVRLVVARVLLAVAAAAVRIARRVVDPVTAGPWCAAASALVDRAVAAGEALRPGARR